MTFRSPFVRDATGITGGEERAGEETDLVMQSYSDVTWPTDALNRRCENPLVFSGYPATIPRARERHVTTLSSE